MAEKGEAHRGGQRVVRVSRPHALRVDEEEEGLAHGPRAYLWHTHAHALCPPPHPPAYCGYASAARLRTRNLGELHYRPLPKFPVGPALGARALKMQRVFSRKQPKSAGATRFWKGSMAATRTDLLCPRITPHPPHRF
jgi:hypothetical protein